MTEKEKMLLGELYNINDQELRKDRENARQLIKKINLINHTQKEIKLLFHKLMPKSSKQIWIEPPFYCDYGYNIEIGKMVYINFDVCILDGNKVSIGNNTLIGPKTQILSSSHPLDSKLRNSWFGIAKEIHIGNNVWIGGGCIINPGVTIGDDSIVASGSLVTKDIPPKTVYGGNPAKWIKNV